MLHRGTRVDVIVDGFEYACEEAVKCLEGMSVVTLDVRKEEDVSWRVVYECGGDGGGRFERRLRWLWDQRRRFWLASIWWRC